MALTGASATGPDLGALETGATGAATTSGATGLGVVMVELTEFGWTAGVGWGSSPPIL